MTNPRNTVLRPIPFNPAVMQAEIQGLLQQIGTLTLQNESLKNTLQQSPTSQSSAVQFFNLKTEIEALKIENQRLQNSNNVLEAKNNRLTQSYLGEFRERQDLQVQIDSMHSQNQSLNNAANDIFSRVTKLYSRIEIDDPHLNSENKTILNAISRWQSSLALHNTSSYIPLHANEIPTGQPTQSLPNYHHRFFNGSSSISVGANNVVSSTTISEHTAKPSAM